MPDRIRDLSSLSQLDRRIAELREDLRELTAQLEDVDKRQREFASAHMTFLTGTGFVFCCSDITERASLDKQLDTLRLERNVLQNKSQAAMRELGDLTNRQERLKCTKT